MDIIFNYMDCRAVLTGTILTISNSKMERVWEVREEGLCPISLKDLKNGDELLNPAEECISPIEVGAGEKLQKVTLEGREEDDFGFARKHLLCNLTVEYEGYLVMYQFAIYPELPVIRSRIFIKVSKKPVLRPTVYLDGITMKEKHCEWENIFLRAVTDSHNNLVHTNKGLFYFNETSKLSGNILKIHRIIQNDGLFFIKESPAVDEQVRYPGYDFVLHGKQAGVLSAGFEESDLFPDEWIPLYGSALGLYHGDDLEFYCQVREYHEARHCYQPDFDGGIVCNTWGDGSRSSKICETFIQDELDAAHDIGITHYQIDAGWESSRKCENADTSLWEIKREVLPNNFTCISDKVKYYGMRLGLWFVPFTDDGKGYDYYKTDAKTLIDLYHNHGSCFFKLDGFKLLNFTATYRFEKMLQLVLKETDSKVFFNIDITNWPRTGYFCGTQYANFFVENRYTDHLSYYPHYTLKNLWELSKYVPTYRIQAEFLNVSRNQNLYEEDQPDDVLAPERCGESYALASVLISSPLAWFEASMMNDENRAAIRSLLNAINSVREDLLKSKVLPIGDMPNGVSFTGFQGIKDEYSGYLLLLKGKNSQNTSHYHLYSGKFGTDTSFKKIVSNCYSEISVLMEDEIVVTLDRDFSFAIYEYEINH